MFTRMSIGPTEEVDGPSELWTVTDETSGAQTLLGEVAGYGVCAVGVQVTRATFPTRDKCMFLPVLVQ
ncbi:hypothetical protein AZG88_42320 [Rhodococcus sp. LB1]|nr:hypothetical protein AZG88_42320 [Rhodococcus sp. LB1]